MSNVEVVPVIQFYADVGGKALDDGFVYIGTSGLDPVANPISMFWDEALTIPAPNPVRTRNGHPDRSGTPSRFFVDVDSYSFAVKNKNGTTIYSALDSLSATDIERRLSNNADPAKGDALIGVKQIGTGSIGRTGHDKNSEFVSAADFGAVGDGVTDDTAEIHAALAAHSNVYLVPGKSYIISELIIPAGRSLGALNGKAELRFTGSSGNAVNIAQPDVTLFNVNIRGPNNTGYDNGLSSPGANYGLNIAGAPSTVKRVTIRDVDVFGFDNTGINLGELATTSSYDKAVNFENVNCYNNRTNWFFGDKAEYCAATNCYGWQGHFGVHVLGGNNKFVNCNFTRNFTNALLDNSFNSAHGGFVGCSFNHATVGGLGLHCKNFNIGEVFTGCFFWFGDIKIESCSGVYISNCELANITITVSGGGLNRIHDNWTFGTITKAFSSTWRVSYLNNRNGVTETAQDNYYPDYYLDVRATANTSWAAATDFHFTAFTTVDSARIAGVSDAGRVFSGNNGAISLTGTYHFNLELSFDAHALAVDQYVTAIIKIFTDSSFTTVRKEHRASMFVKAAATKITIPLTFSEWCAFNEFYRVYAATTDTVRGFTINNAGTAQPRLLVSMQ